MAALLLTASVGCFSDQLLVGTALGPKASVPTRMVLTISPTPLEQDGKPVINGVICRAYYFVGNDAFPVIADGEMVLTAYDSTKPRTADRKPDGLFRISAEKLPQHYRKDAIGHSYVFWLPYDPQTRCQLTFEPCFNTCAGTTITTSPISVEMGPLNTSDVTIVDEKVDNRPGE